MASRTNAGALRETVKASPVLDRPEHAALMRLAFTLARQMDAAGPDPSTRLSAAYLSVLKDVRRVIEADAATRPAGGDTGKRAKLAALRAQAAG